MDRDRNEQERPLIKVRAAFGKPLYEHSSELHGAISDWLFLQFGSRSLKHLSSGNSRTSGTQVRPTATPPEMRLEFEQSKPNRPRSRTAGPSSKQGSNRTSIFKPDLAQIGRAS